jgi:hypothetical protein
VIFLGGVGLINAESIDTKGGTSKPLPRQILGLANDPNNALPGTKIGQVLAKRMCHGRGAEFCQFPAP